MSTSSPAILNSTEPASVGAKATSGHVQRKCRQQFSIVQLSTMEVAVSALDSECLHFITANSEIEGVDVWKPKVLVWRSADADVYELEVNGIKHVSHFAIPEGSSLLIHHSCIFQICGSGLKVLSLQGSEIETLFSNSPHDSARRMDVCEEHLILTTEKMFIHTWRISGSEIKPYGLRRRVMIEAEAAAEVFFVSCNCDGTKLSFLTASSASDADSCFYIYDLIAEKLQQYSFRSSNSKPCSVGWDDEEPRLIACETSTFVRSDNSRAEPVRQVTTFFVDSLYGVLEQAKVCTESRNSRFLGMHVPYVYFVQDPEKDIAWSMSAFQKHTLCDFIGMEDVDSKTRAALLEYSYNLALGKVHVAYNILDSIPDPDIWKKIVRTCVYSRRINVARHCFAKMKCASAAAFVRWHLDEPEEEARVAAVAIQLDLKEEARRLYVDCGRYDLLIEMYQMYGDWEKALEVASKNDRVNLKNTHHAYAKHLEALGQTTAAVQHYELAETSRYEVPRMLHSLQQIDELKDYVDRKNDPVLQKWWGHLCEANNQMSDAAAYYKAAGDTTSLVRVYCNQNDFASAHQVVIETASPSAAFYLARQYEKIGNVPLAIQFFCKAGKFEYAAQLAMKHGVDSELLSLSLQCSTDQMLASAQYFETKGMHEESVLLYHKGGDTEKAIDVCFRSQLFDALKAIAEDLKEGTDPAVLARCGDFLMGHNQTEKAVQLFIVAKQYDHALDLCIQEGVCLTERMADSITPSKEGRKTEDSVRLLLRVADCCKNQGSYHLACKKYAQAGDRVKAMRALLKSGDTERIIFFANVSRQKQLYVLAANYLQSLDFRQDGSIMKNIVQMYTKAGEMQLLASFYESCAQIEIDEFRDYEKALNAMKEAVRCLARSSNSNRDDAMRSLQRRTCEVERFVQVRRMAKSNPDSMVRGCNELLQQLSKTSSLPESTPQAAVRVGDVYALLIELYHSQGNMEQAYDMMEKMKSGRVPLGPYVDRVIVEAIYEANGLATKDMSLGGEDEIVEDIVYG